MRNAGSKRGFTLIELSIVLVIIGLIVGGILVGQDLIKNAEVRAQLSQIEKYNQAVNTFRSKFGGLPGDLALATASQFGFTTLPGCGGGQGARDGNGLIDGMAGGWVLYQDAGETEMFWMDLSSPVAGSLIEGSFPNSGASGGTCWGGQAAVTNTTQGTSFIGDYLPLARIGHGNFVYVYEASGYNWYSISAITAIATNGIVTNGGTIPVIQAYNMDKKIDDGLPTTGAVMAMYAGNQQPNTSPSMAPSASSDTTTSCYNNTSGIYSISSYANYGAGGNCELSFRFQ